MQTQSKWHSTCTHRKIEITNYIRKGMYDLKETENDEAYVLGRKILRLENGNFI